MQLGNETQKALVMGICAASDELWTWLERRGTAVSLQAGNLVWEWGDAVGQVMFVQEGMVRVRQLDARGHEITLYRVGERQACPLSLLAGMSGGLYPAWSIVEQEGIGLSVPVREWIERTAQSEDAMRYLWESLNQRVEGLLTLLTDVAFESIDARIAVFLLARVGWEEDLPMTLQVTHEEIAGELGTAREVVSRRLKQFEREGGLQLGRAHIRLNGESVRYLRGKL